MNEHQKTVLHYVGYDDDRGGIVAVVRALAGVGKFDCILGVNPGCQQMCGPVLPVLELPAVDGERIGLANIWRTRLAAKAVRRWLREDRTRIFHGHSRAGLMVALWLSRWGERRVVVSVHCFGRQRWFYRLAARQLGGRLYWLTPAMRGYYGVRGEGWAQCIPGCFVAADNLPARSPMERVVRLAGVGFLMRWKGWHHVIEALALLPESVRARFQFEHIGAVQDSLDAKNYARELLERTTSAGLASNVLWLGEQPSSAGLLARSDFLVVASNNEPFSIAMLEALSAGVPVIAADSGGAQDVLRPPINGLLFRSGDAADLSRVLRSLVEKNAGADVHVDAEDIRRFSPERLSSQWLEIYRRL